MDSYNHTHLLIVRLEGFEEDTGVVAGSKTSGSKSLSYGEKSAKSFQKAAMGLVSYATLAATADKLISYELSQVELRTGAREYEQKLQFGYSVAKKSVGALTSIGLGAAVGGLPGAVVGLVASGVNMAIDFMQKQNTIKTKENLEDVSIGMANIRAGTAGRRVNQ